MSVVRCAVCDIGLGDVEKRHGWKGEYWWVWFEEVPLGAWGGLEKTAFQATDEQDGGRGGALGEAGSATVGVDQDA